MDKEKIVFKGSHPDSLYRVPIDSETNAGKTVRVLRFLRWPAALVVVCVALAVFVYFLMPDNMQTDPANATHWESVAFEAAHTQRTHIKTHKLTQPPDLTRTKDKDQNQTKTQGTRITEIDFYNADNNKNDLTSIITTGSTVPTRKLPIPPVFPSHISPEVQYGNERADTDQQRSPRIMDEKTAGVPEDSTLKPHITQKPEKPLAIYFKEGTAISNPSTETIYKAETNNDFTTYGEKYTTKTANNHQAPVYKMPLATVGDTHSPGNVNKQLESVRESELPEYLESFNRQLLKAIVDGANDSKFTSGHSKLFGISIEDAEKMRSTTQSSLYNTRVSPTLPTWRDRDDTTTKKYPVNVNSDVPQCRSTRLALCRDVLPYDLAGVALTINGVNAPTLLPQIEYLVATNCSDRARHFACALLEPECNPPPYPSKMPCYNLCKAVVDNCDGMIPSELIPAFNCNQYSDKDCVSARTPCFSREFSCGDGTCVPRDWLCDGTHDCPHGEDEIRCASCEANEFRCHSGGCIQKRWLCDGYADCPEGEDEMDDTCESKAPRGDLGEEPAGSAPAPAVRKPYRLPSGRENDSSKELLVTSDSTNALKRNFTRRPSPSRLTPYSRPMLHKKPKPTEDVFESKKSTPREIPNAKKSNDKTNSQSNEDVNIHDIFFEEFEKEKERTEKKSKERPKYESTTIFETQQLTKPTRLDKSINKLNRVIDGVAMMKKAQEEEDNIGASSTESNNTNTDMADEMIEEGSISAHASPCPSGELRCVDGRCITLAQLCDGTIDCSDHADEDNCYT